MSIFTRFGKKKRENTEPQDRWRSIYQLPLYTDDHTGYVWSDNDVMALSGFDSTTSDEEVGHIVAIINGREPSDYEPMWRADKDRAEIYFGKTYKFCVRGWGYLIGCCAMNLPRKTAAAIQDQFMDYIVRQLNGTQTERERLDMENTEFDYGYGVNCDRDAQ